MKYKFKTNIEEKEFNSFVQNFPSTCFMQTSNWAKVKTSWEHDLVGMYENDKLLCSAMILKRNLFLGKKLIYIPRGFAIDYSNEELLQCFVISLKKYAKENNAIDIKIDPYICFKEDNIKNIKKNKGIEIKRYLAHRVKK